MKTRKIKIFDTTLRDGEQSPGCTMTLEDKFKIARQLKKLNVDIIEAGFPIASPGDFEAVKTIAQEIKGPTIAGLARCIEKDIDQCWNAVQYSPKPRIHIFLATSPIHMKYKLKKTPKEIIRDAVKFTKYAKNYCTNVEFSPEDASRTQPKFLYEVLEKVIDAGATTVNIPDTVGYSIPSEFAQIIQGIKKNVSNIDQATISAHCHNDLGLSVANSIAAIEQGAGQVECTINGIGERAGNASLEEIVMTLETRKKDLKAYTGIKLNEIYKTSRMVTLCTGMTVQRNKAIVGENAFAHESGIHQHGILSHPKAYEIMTAKKIGRTTDMIIGKHSGKHAIQSELEKMGYKITRKELNQIVEKIKTLADKQKIVQEADLDAIVRDVCTKANDRIAPIQIEEISILTGNKVTPTATLKLKINGKTQTIASTGIGPVDAVANAMAQIAPSMKLKEFEIRAVTSGTNALGEVTIKVEDQKHNPFIVKAVHEDIVQASAIALVNGANKVINYQKMHRGKFK
ncbi:MAG: 2-isopropylmalate synthase [Candidatus Diapherotrites archaeon]|nr:2-isopropylmalate synthase [Candidatus Diapherotrites archaeon]